MDAGLVVRVPGRSLRAAAQNPPLPRLPSEAFHDKTTPIARLPCTSGERPEENVDGQVQPRFPRHQPEMPSRNSILVFGGIK
jgi:hypothetical protein